MCKEVQVPKEGILLDCDCGKLNLVGLRDAKAWVMDWSKWVAFYGVFGLLWEAKTQAYYRKNNMEN